ncbi:MAG: hypothetical protein L6243_01320 [Candidatus Altiarchaeales archaeon]|nr:hypothetical protein [Candidatus Altiarchaeota archaeon]MCG2782210.1 hypothetical protein [Candidatus Altiarchaeales archaeon]MBU4267029.1 hypothetical protein [Candidatus Altiarchaeota archaeon]MBU4341527.1 hypothetical protein [Candidatus Altiarchaeota archaeon]MBU4406816.1 hypothetical protein [Candidatus Altiarchaeota archaeon]
MRRIALVVFIALMSACVQDSGIPDSGIEVRGRIYVTGNEPFTQLAVEAPEGSYCLTGADELRNMQGQTLTIRGELTDEFCGTSLGETIAVEEFE